MGWRVTGLLWQEVRSALTSGEYHFLLVIKEALDTLASATRSAADRSDVDTLLEWVWSGKLGKSLCSSLFTS